jgi:polyhydroxyalkanoate synthesis repressor PhaR
LQGVAMLNESDLKKDHETIVIKKYPNRRLYNTDTSTYVTLDDLCELVKKGSDFVVHDAKTGDDLTRQILTQIIFEQETKGSNMLPISFLRSVIGFYDGKMQDYVPHYLDAVMHNFSNNQEKMREMMNGALSGGATGFSPFGGIEEIGKQNMALMQNALKMWSPFGLEGTASAAKPAAAPPSSEPGADIKGDETFDELRRQLEEMQARLAGLTKKG